MRLPGEDIKKREIYGDLRAIAPVFIRLDGRSFHRLAKDLELKKPFDEEFSSIMEGVCTHFMRESGFSPLFAYTFSDEINIYLKILPFNGRIEKLDAVSASYAASAFTILSRIDHPVAFDSRIIPLHEDQVRSYLIWRQNEAWRNHINSYSQHALLLEGYSSSQTAEMLFGIPANKLHDMMFSRGINLAKTPPWQRRGIMVASKSIQKQGYNKKTKTETITTRNTIYSNRDLPLFSSEEGEVYINSLLA
ncbi:MAG: tRNA 5'-guanylyltransferase [Methanospirillaceae archaeon]|nr:tRNA 5'-guanylyltransferase [Methanospirillaceae archaeon]